MSKPTESQTLDKRFHHIGSGQRSEIARTIRKQLELYGGLPGLHKRHKARIVRSLAMKYGVPDKVIVDIYERAMTQRVERRAKETTERLKANPPGSLITSGPKR